jgi:putative ABC transport system ATP-binding protein
MAEDTLVRCRGIAKTFGTGHSSVVALHGVDCSIRPGDRIALAGPSGSGKSTLLHIFAGIERPTVGDITWPGLGEVLRPGPVSMIFQANSLIPALDVAENVALPLVLAGASPTDAKSKAMDALDTLGLSGLSRSLPTEISGGQAQRVAVARSLAGEHRLILADEPTGQLDHVTGTEVIETLLETAHRLDAGLVVATHDPLIVAAVGNEWRMTDGRLRIGEPA